jgi:hypothetical protein
MRIRAYRIVVAALLLPLLDLPAAAAGLDLGLDLGKLKLDLNLDGGGASVQTELFGSDAGVNADLFGPATTGSEPLVLTQDEALDAVANRRAMPLDKVMVIAQLATTGEIIDAALVDINGFLLYVFKVLETSGDVSQLYFYARSGQMVEIR